MGSIEAACISGFLCRLCSEMHRTVIHIYGDQGQKHELAKKINAYLPVTITPNDPLPKTICENCMTRVEQHHELMIKMEKHRSFFAAQSARAQLIRSGEARNSSALTNRSETATNRRTRTATPTVTVTSASITSTTTTTTPSSDRISPNRNTVDSNRSTSSSDTDDNNRDANSESESTTTTTEAADTCDRGNSNNNNTNNNSSNNRQNNASLAENLQQNL